MLHTLAKCVDIGHTGTHLVIDHDTSFNVQTCINGETGRRSYAHCHNDNFCRQHLPILQANACHRAIAAVNNFLSVSAGYNGYAALAKRFFKQPCGGSIKLFFHQRFHQVQHRYFHALLCQTGGCLQPE